MHVFGLLFCSGASSLVPCLTNFSCFKGSKLQSLLLEHENTAVHCLNAASLWHSRKGSLKQKSGEVERSSCMFPSLQASQSWVVYLPNSCTDALFILSNFIIFYGMRTNPMPIIIMIEFGISLCHSLMFLRYTFNKLINKLTAHFCFYPSHWYL